jgi:citrate synthase
MQQKFKAKAEGAGPGNAWCFIAVPFNVSEVWSVRGQLPVRGTINGFPYRTTIQPMDGRHLLTFNKQLQAGAKAKSGDTVSVVMERDTEERIVEVPAELAKAFRKNKEAKKLWDKLAYTHRKEFARWISGAKQEETRERRAAKAVDMMLTKKTMSGSR